jgi:aspartate 1-decarboxylase
MRLTMCKSKIHRATVTQSELNYEGSITIDQNLLAEADILPFEKVQVVDVNSGSRFETYTYAGPAGSGVICVNGAAARLVQPGDKVIIVSYAEMERAEAERHVPRLVLVDDDNRVKKVITDLPQPVLEPHVYGT